jgi:dimethylamine monooxygenase subunit A
VGREPGREGVECVFGAAGFRWRVEADRLRLQSDRPDAVPVVDTLSAGDDPGRALGALAMSLQEDLVLMETGPDGVARAVVFHVSFPSSWNPAAKLGQDLLALHGPVADNALLQSAATRLGKALVSKGPFVRWVWTITANPCWRAWPPRAPAAGPPLHFRLERQTTMPLGDGYGLFLIRVQVRPLVDVLAQPGRLALLQASLRSMSEEMVRYKSLGPVRDVVLRM